MAERFCIEELTFTLLPDQESSGDKFDFGEKSII